MILTEVAQGVNLWRELNSEFELYDSVDFMNNVIVLRTTFKKDYIIKELGPRFDASIHLFAKCDEVKIPIYTDVDIFKELDRIREYWFSLLREVKDYDGVIHCPNCGALVKRINYNCEYCGGILSRKLLNLIKMREMRSVEISNHEKSKVYIKGIAPKWNTSRPEDSLYSKVLKYKRNREEE